jgi:UDPglucose 6-dehydrogenase
VYASWIPQSRILTTNVFSSELAKLVANAMLAQRISSINSIAAVCDEAGADVDEVARAIGADPRIGRQFLRAGIGFGGSCFKKDVLSLVYLAETLVLPEVADYWRAVIAMNEFARNRFVSRVVKGLNNTLAGKKVTVLGYAFKKDTNDTRESPALDIIRSLAEEGPREIAIFDPLCIPAQIMDEVSGSAGLHALQSRGGRVAVYADAYAACQGSHAVLITTEFDEFKNTPQERTLEDHPQVFEKVELDHSQVLTIPSNQTTPPNAEDGPLNGFNPMPPCAEDCPDCQAQNIGQTTSYRAKDSVPKARLDWRKVHHHMKRPHLVFDGRGVLDIAAMEGIGFRVESVGRRSGMAVI